MRLWVGIEMEGPRKGLRTLFIETPMLTTGNKVDGILKAIELSKPEALYFGAGRVNTLFDEEALRTILNACQNDKIVFTLEVGDLSYALRVLDTVLTYDIMVVHRTMLRKSGRLKELMEKVYNKVDDNEVVLISKFESTYETSLETLVNGQYQGVDEEIKLWEEEK